MCDPITATGIALSAGGGFLQAREADKNARRVTNARNDAFAEGMYRQRQFQDESGQAFNDNVDAQSRENFDEEQDKEVERFKQAFGGVRTQPDYNTGLRPSAPKNVVIARERESNKASDETNRDVDNLALLNSYGGASFNQGLDRSQFARLFGNIQDKASRDSRLLPLEIEAAGNNAQKGPSLFPALLKTAGQGLSIYGAANPGSTFLDQQAFGPLAQGQTWQDLTTPGLFTKGRNAIQAFGSQIGV
jgi:hypothetical protein